MCGIVGMFGDDLNISLQDKRNFIYEAMIVNTLRGYDSTGLFTISRNPTYTPHRTYKKALAGYDFVQLKAVNKILEQLVTMQGIVIHNRAMTRGNVTDHNAHPFKYDHITMVHNGTVYNADKLVSAKDRPNATVDSDYIAHALSLEEPDDVLPKLQGSFTLVWHNSEDNSLHLARNSQRPLFLAFDSKRENCYFASECEMLIFLAARNKFAIDKDIYDLTPNVHYIIKNAKNVREVEKRPFVQRSLPVITAPGSSGRTHSRTGPWTPSAAPTSSSGTGGQPGTTTGTTTTSHPAASEKMSPTDAAQHSRAAKGEDRLKQLRTIMAEHKYDVGKPVIAVPRMWAPYRSNKDKDIPLGYMLCHEHNRQPTEANLQVFGILEKDWKEKWSKSRIILNIVNFRENPKFQNYPVILVCEINKELQQKYDKVGKEKQVSTPKIDKMDFIEIGTSRKRSISNADYLLLVSDGCYNCRDELTNPDLIMWVGDNDDKPICHTCYTNDLVLEALQHVH